MYSYRGGGVYRFSLHLREKRPYEILITRTHSFRLPPGAVAFALAACRDREDVREFMDRFRVASVRDWNRTIPASDPVAVEILLLERFRVERFIATCLLVSPPPWAEGVPPSRRVAAFFLQGESEKVREHLKGVSLAPAADLRQIPRPHTAKGKAALARYHEAWEGKDAAPGVLRRELGHWQTFAWRYTADTIQAVVWLELLELAREDMVAKACRKCGGYFVPVPANTAYCPTCRQNTTRQALHYHRKKEAIAREGRTEEVRRQRREYMREYRRKKKGALRQ